MTTIPSTVPLRIGIAFHGDPLDPGSWSGTPRGIADGLRAAGHEVVGLSALPAPAVDAMAQRILAVPRMIGEIPAMITGRPIREALGHAKSVARITPGYKSLGSLTMKRALKQAGLLDLVIRMGSSFEVDHHNVITFEDMTVRQALHAGWPDWARLDPVSQRIRIAAQGRAYRDAIVCCTATPWTARSVVEDYGIAAEKVIQVGLGAHHVIDAVESRDWSAPRFLFVGKDWERKNGPVVLAAFARFHQENPDARLDLVGYHPEVDQPGVTGHGFLDLSEDKARATMAQLYSSATCLVVPSTFEPAGIVHLEAAAAGIPSIGSRRGGASDIIGSAGVTVVPDDIDGLVKAMYRLSSPETARRVGEAGRQRAELFTWEKVAHRILQAAGYEPRDASLWDGLFTDPSTFLT